MVNKAEFIKFLSYIGIKEENQDKIYKLYLRCCNKTPKISKKRKIGVVNENYEKYRMSNIRTLMSVLEYEEDAIDTVIAYLAHLDFREAMDEEVSKYGVYGTWGKNMVINEN